MYRFMILLVALCCLSIISSVAAQQPPSQGDDFLGRKFALVIGNSAYKQYGLKNPAADAEDISASLRKIGFKVTTVLDASLEQMRLALIDFEASLPDQSAAFFFFAGHGVQHHGQNFLLPVDSIGRVKRARDLPANSIALNNVLNILDGRNESISIMVLDACRNSPFASIDEIQSGLSRNVSIDGSENVGGKSSNKTGTLEGSIIAYSTAPDTVASDGNGRNSPYSKHLKEFLLKPNVRLETVLKLTRQAVTHETQGRQTPWYETSITGEFFPAGRGRIEFEDLLKGLIPPLERDIANAYYAYPWDVDFDGIDVIKWRHDGISSNETVHVFTPDWSTIETPFNRVGDVVVLMDGVPTHDSLGREAVPWTIQQMGARTGVSYVSISSQVMGFGGMEAEHGFGKAIFMDEDPKCTNKNGLDGSRVFKINLEGHGPAWLAEMWSCGASNCSANYVLFYNEQDRKRFMCKS